MADCESCKNFSKTPICSTCESGSDFEKITITNADKIRNMSDEELAEFLPIVFDCMCQPTEECLKITCNRGTCTKTTECAMKYLQSEAE